MSERVSLGAAGKPLGAAGRPGAHWIEVSWGVCGAVRQVRPSLVKGYTHLVCGPCGKAGRRPDVPSRAGMVPVHAFNVAGSFDGCTYRIARPGSGPVLTGLPLSPGPRL